MSITNKELVQKINAEFSKGINGNTSEYLNDNIKWNIIGMPVISGKNNFLAAIKTLQLENFPAASVKNIIAEGDFVVVESRGKNGIESGKPCCPSYCDIYHIQNGKLAELTTYVVDLTADS